MCGITAFSGKYAPNKAVAMTLGQLSRGIQGAGVAFIADQSLHVVKAPIHPLQLATQNKFFWGLKTYSAISHNRMPSKGNVKLENTHPFMDCQGRFALVHNGTVLGLDNTREQLKAEGHQILGDTDSEVVAHLICKHLNEGGDMLGALHKIMQKHPATFLVLTREGDIYGLKASQPLWVCEIEVCENQTNVAIASERKAIELALPELANHKHTMTELKPNDILHVRGGRVLLLDHHEPPADFEWNKPPPAIRNIMPDDNRSGTIMGYDRTGKRVELKYPHYFSNFPDKRFKEFPQRR